MKRKLKNGKFGFTLVELLAVIVVLGLILIIAVPKVLETLNAQKKKTLELTTRSIIKSAEEKYIENTTYGITEEITCESVSNFTDTDIDSCEIEFDKDGNARVTIKGKGKYKGLYVCDGTKEITSVTNEECLTAELLKSNFDFTITNEASGSYPLIQGRFTTAQDFTNIDSVIYELYRSNGSNTSNFELLYTKTKENIEERFLVDFSEEKPDIFLSYTYKIIVYYENGVKAFETTKVKEAYCFVAGTKVMTENGYENIENIKLGDKVYSYNLDTNMLELKEVIRTIKSEAYVTYKMTIGTETVEMSHKHQLYIIDKGWVRAYDVVEGDMLLTSDNKKVKITNIEKIIYDEPIPTYNLTVDGNSNYFVTNIQVLVHNFGSK